MLSKVNIKESLQFLVVCRETLANVIEQSSIPAVEKEKTKNFLYNEASDYQIMSLVVDEVLPEEKYNPVGEALLFEDLNTQIINSYDIVSEFLNSEMTADLLCEIGPVSPASSSKPILEFLSRTNQQVVLQELDPENPFYKFARGAKGAYKSVKNFDPAKAAKDAWASAKGDVSKAGDILKKKANAAQLDYQRGTSLAGEKMRKMGTSQLTGSGAGDAIRDKARMGQLTPGEKISGALSTAGKYISKKAGEAGQAIQKGAGEYAGAVKKGAEKMGKGLQVKMANVLDDIQQKYPDAFTAAGKAVDKAQAMAKQTGAYATSDRGAFISAVALAALISYGAYKLYKTKLSAAGKACGGQKGSQKKMCLKKFKVEAIKAQIANMQKASGFCAKTKNPGKCKSAVQRKIQKLQMKAQKASK